MRTIIGLNKCVLPVLLSFFIILAGCAESQSAFPAGPIVVKQSGGAGLLIAECQDKQYIINMADYIVEGKVEKVESRWNDDKSAIFTYIDLTIENYIKGAPFGEKELQIVTPGGTVGDTTQVTEDQPIFHKGKGVRVYFQEIDGEFHIVCAQFGVEELEPLSPTISH